METKNKKKKYVSNNNREYESQELAAGCGRKSTLFNWEKGRRFYEGENEFPVGIFFSKLVRDTISALLLKRADKKIDLSYLGFLKKLTFKHEHEV